jgi:hypothetical protein
MATSRGIMDDLVARGLATPIKFSDINKYDYAGRPPIKSDWGCGRYLTMDICCPLSVFQSHIILAFSRIEGLRYDWDPAKCVWRIEYGTKPIECGKSSLEYMQITNGRFVACQAAATAYEKFPHLHLDFDNEDPQELGLIPLYNGEPGRWCKIELSIFYTDKNRNCLHINHNRTTGDRTTNVFIWRIIRDYFEENQILISREAYLCLLEGTQPDYIECTEGMCIGGVYQNDHITHYLMDILVVKEICTYIQYGVEIK